MIVQADVSPEELKVFLEEVEEHIQVLDEDLIRLEKDGDNPEILQRIFRAAHTLKGSSGMLGHRRMAEVTHAMESLLDKLRNKKLEVCSAVIDSLLFALDAIKLLKDEVVSNEECGIDTAAIVAQLNQAAEQVTPARKSGKNGGKANITTTGNDSFMPSLNAREMKKVIEAVNAGRRVVTIDVRIDDASEWKAVRCLQVLNELATLGEVIASQPSARDIEQEKAGSRLLIVLSTERDDDKIVLAARSVTEVNDARVTQFTLEDTGEPNKERATETETGAGTKMSPSGVMDKTMNTMCTRTESLQSIRVDVKVLDALMNMVEELVIDRARISQVGRQLESKYPDDDLIGDLAGTSNHIIKVINELHQDIMKVRMVPVSLVFNKFPRLVRDLAQKQKKDLEFVVKGEETELDRTIIEQINDPLIHLLRNAVDHGIETPEERRALGKPARAMVKLSAYQEEGHIIITLEDDGRGIDPAKVRESAVKKGFMTREQVDALTDEEAIDLIFSPGMSTASKVTDVSGRGVGLDIVRTNIERLNGTVQLNTCVNRGTKFIVKLPLTVAVFQGLMVAVCNMTLIVPLVSVVETIRITNRDVKTILGQEVMRLRDRVIPLVRLGTALGLTDDVKAVSEEKYVIVVKVADRLAGIVVDRLMEQQEFVIKALNRYLGNIKGIAGATILGDGNVALILDVPTLIRMVTQQGQMLQNIAA